MRKPLIDKDCVSKLETALKYELGHFYLYKHLAMVTYSPRWKAKRITKTPV